MTRIQPPHLRKVLNRIIQCRKGLSTRLVINNKDAYEMYQNMISNYVQLWHLDLRRNDMTTVPIGINNLINLTYLDLSNNQLTSIPDEIFGLTKLSKLKLHNNKISGALSPKIKNMTNLSHLNLANNELTSIPFEIYYLHNKLRFINLSYNRIQKVPWIIYYHLIYIRTHSHILLLHGNVDRNVRYMYRHVQLTSGLFANCTYYYSLQDRIQLAIPKIQIIQARVKLWYLRHQHIKRCNLAASVLQKYVIKYAYRPGGLLYNKIKTRFESYA